MVDFAGVDFDIPMSPKSSFIANRSFFNAPAMPSQDVRKEEGRRPLVTMVARPPPMIAYPPGVIERKKRARRESFASYLEDNWEDLDNERLSELHCKLVKLKDQRVILDKQIQGLEEYMGEIWEEAERRIENEEKA